MLHFLQNHTYRAEAEKSTYTSVNRSSLVQVIARRGTGNKSLPNPIQPHCRLDLYKQTSVKFEWEYQE